jgi:hypothetical protein
LLSRAASTTATAATATATATGAVTAITRAAAVASLLFQSSSVKFMFYPPSNF